MGVMVGFRNNPDVYRDRMTVRAGMTEGAGTTVAGSPEALAGRGGVKFQNQLYIKLQPRRSD